MSRRTISPAVLMSVTLMVAAFWVNSQLNRPNDARVWAQTNGPTLSIPTGLVATFANTVTVPIDYRRNNAGIAGLTFSIDFDPNCLHFNATDNNGDLQPDAVRFNLPAQLRGSASYNPADSDGELDVVIADYIPPLSTLPDTDELVMIVFTAVCVPMPGQTIVTPVNFSAQPAPSFSDTNGADISGLTINGTVEIRSLAPTLTATPTLVPTSPPDATATATPGDPTALDPDNEPVLPLNGGESLFLPLVAR